MNNIPGPHYKTHLRKDGPPLALRGFSQISSERRGEVSQDEKGAYIIDCHFFRLRLQRSKDDKVLLPTFSIPTLSQTARKDGAPTVSFKHHSHGLKNKRSIERDMTTNHDDTQRGKQPSNAVKLDVLLPTIGSAGDVHPFIALGTSLQKRGHHATIVTNEFFEQQVRDAGLGFVALGTIREAEEAIADPRLCHETKSFACV